MRTLRFGYLALCLAALSIGGCQDRAENPTTPTPIIQPPPVTLMITDRDTGNPVSGAKATVGSVEVTTDGAGKATFRQGIEMPATVEISAIGYRLRNAKVPSNGAIDLMPIRDDIGMTDRFIDHILFWTLHFSPSMVNIGTFTIGRDLSIVADPSVTSPNMGSINLGIERINGLLSAVGSPYRAHFDGATPVADRIPVWLVVNPAIGNNSASVWVQSGDGLVSSVTIFFAKLSHVGDSMTVTHSLGHVLGLGNTDVNGVMEDISFTGVSWSIEWTPAEIKAFRLLTRTKPGTKLKDDSR
jgi:hypothetical protein